jgi:hypothetical protein
MPMNEHASDAAQPRRRDQDARTGSDAAATRIQHQARWVDLQIQQAMERGEFDDLPGAGKPLGDLGSPHDRDWWLKKLIEREQITGVLPPALQLRKEDASLDAELDRETAEQVVRRIVEDFNTRVIEARRQLQGGPPVVTRTRDVDAEVERWRTRLRERRQRRPTAASQADKQAPEQATGPNRPRRRWLRRSWSSLIRPGGTSRRASP